MIPDDSPTWVKPPGNPSAQMRTTRKITGFHLLGRNYQETTKKLLDSTYSDEKIDETG